MFPTDVRIVRQDDLHLNVDAPGLTIMSTVGALASRLVLNGDLDIATTSAFDAVVDHSLVAGPPRLDVDLAGLSFLGAAGITSFNRAEDKCRYRGGRVLLERVDRRTRRLLVIVRCDHLLAAD